MLIAKSTPNEIPDYPDWNKDFPKDKPALACLSKAF